MNFISYLFIAVMGTCVLTFGVFGLFVNRFLKLASPVFKAAHSSFNSTNKSERNSYSKATSPRRSFFDKQTAEDVAFEELV